MLTTSPQSFNTSSSTQAKDLNSLYLVDLRPILDNYQSYHSLWPLYVHYPLQDIITDLLRMTPYAGKEDPLENFFINLEEKVDNRLGESCYDPMGYLWPDHQFNALDLEIVIQQLLQDIDYCLHQRFPPWMDYVEFAIVQWFGTTAVFGRIFDEKQGLLDPGKVVWRRESRLTRHPWR